MTYPHFFLFVPGDMTHELVRHFLIETGPRGVKLKGCPNEPNFGEPSPPPSPLSQACPGFPDAASLVARVIDTAGKCTVTPFLCAVVPSLCQIPFYFCPAPRGPVTVISGITAITKAAM